MIGFVMRWLKCYLKMELVSLLFFGVWLVYCLSWFVCSSSRWCHWWAMFCDCGSSGHLLRIFRKAKMFIELPVADSPLSPPRPTPSPPPPPPPHTHTHTTTTTHFCMQMFVHKRVGRVSTESPKIVE